MAIDEHSIIAEYQEKLRALSPFDTAGPIIHEMITDPLFFIYADRIAKSVTGNARSDAAIRTAAKRVLSKLHSQGVQAAEHLLAARQRRRYGANPAFGRF